MSRPTSSMPAASSSSAPLSPTSPPRAQAGPLPTKRGEIGYDEDVHGRAMAAMDQQIASERPAVAMGERHPADQPPEGAVPSGPPAAGAPAADAAASSGTDTSSVTSSARMAKLQKLRARNVGGITIFTLGAFELYHYTCIANIIYGYTVKLLISLLILAGTGVGWAFSIIMLQRTNQNTDPNQVDQGFSGANSQIFVHVAFGVLVLAQLVLLERLIFRVRAERYAFKHPGEMLRRGHGNTSMPMVCKLPIQYNYNKCSDPLALVTGTMAASAASDIRSRACTKRRTNWRR